MKSSLNRKICSTTKNSKPYKIKEIRNQQLNVVNREKKNLTKKNNYFD